MTEEIKEILYMLKSVIDNPKETFCANATTCYLLLNYITNLQKENKELKERYDLVCKISEERKNKWLTLNDENEDLFNVIKDYKSRNEKAIEYIKIYRSYENIDGTDYLKGRNEIGSLSLNQVDNLLNILQGGDE